MSVDIRGSFPLMGDGFVVEEAWMGLITLSGDNFEIEIRIVSKV